MNDPSPPHSSATATTAGGAGADDVTSGDGLTNHTAQPPPPPSSMMTHNASSSSVHSLELYGVGGTVDGFDPSSTTSSSVVASVDGGGGGTSSSHHHASPSSFTHPSTEALAITTATTTTTTTTTGGITHPYHPHPTSSYQQHHPSSAHHINPSHPYSDPMTSALMDHGHSFFLGGSLGGATTTSANPSSSSSSSLFAPSAFSGSTDHHLPMASGVSDLIVQHGNGISASSSAYPSFTMPYTNASGGNLISGSSNPMYHAQEPSGIAPQKIYSSSTAASAPSQSSSVPYESGLSFPFPTFHNHHPSFPADALPVGSYTLPSGSSFHLPSSSTNSSTISIPSSGGTMASSGTRGGGSAYGMNSTSSSSAATAVANGSVQPSKKSSTLDSSSSTPKIYGAVYSGIPVYEMSTHNVDVMRRQSDSYLNATQILKVAGLEKGKRTKILEKEIIKGTHEKVQGGYGKYQGTWIPFDRAVALANTYNVAHILKPLFDYVIPANATINDLLPGKETVSKPRNTTGAPTTSKRKSMSKAAEVAVVEQALMATKKSRRSSRSVLVEAAVPDIAPAPTLFTEPSSANPGLQRDLTLDIAIDRHRTTLMAVFLNEDPEPLNAVDPSFEQHVDLDMDDQGHSALHWAAQMGFMPILQILMAKGADIRRLNHVGETPLIRSVLATNNFDSQSFPALLDVLKETLFMVDAKQRTLLHNIMISLSLKGRRPQAARYYADCLFEFLAKKDAAAAVSAPADLPVTKGDLKTLLDMQDCEGDTALNIAARNGNVSLVQILLSLGADASIPNKAGLLPRHFGMEHLIPGQGNHHHHRQNSGSDNESVDAAQPEVMYPSITQSVDTDGLAPISRNLSSETRFGGAEDSSALSEQRPKLMSSDQDGSMMFNRHPHHHPQQNHSYYLPPHTSHHSSEHVKMQELVYKIEALESQLAAATSASALFQSGDESELLTLAPEQLRERVTQGLKGWNACQAALSASQTTITVYTSKAAASQAQLKALLTTCCHSLFATLPPGVGSVEHAVDLMMQSLDGLDPGVDVQQRFAHMDHWLATLTGASVSHYPPHPHHPASSLPHHPRAHPLQQHLN